jgi:hypothetical protein
MKRPREKRDVLKEVFALRYILSSEQGEELDDGALDFAVVVASRFATVLTCTLPSPFGKLTVPVGAGT